MDFSHWENIISGKKMRLGQCFFDKNGSPKLTEAKVQKYCFDGVKLTYRLYEGVKRKCRPEM